LHVTLQLTIEHQAPAEQTWFKTKRPWGPSTNNSKTFMQAKITYLYPFKNIHGLIFAFMNNTQ